MRIFGSKELKTDVLNTERCIGCGACINLCPYFGSYRGKTANLFPCTLETGRCFALCPKIEVDLDAISQQRFGQPYAGNPLGEYRFIKAAKAGPKTGKGSYQSGGTVSSLIRYALKSGMINAAILTDKVGILPQPKIVTKEEGVYQCAGSKYTAAPTLAALNQAISEGYNKIGIVGTPCQTLSVAKLKCNPMNEVDFKDPVTLVIGLFCTWSLNFRSFEPFISKIVDIEKIQKVDIPPPPAEVFEIYTDKDKIEIPLEDIRRQVSDSCTYCPDMTSEFSDLSVGVLEGQSDTNTLIVRTEKGEQLVMEAEKHGYLIVEDIHHENLDHLISAATNKKETALGKANEEGLINTEDENRRALFRFTKDILGKDNQEGKHDNVV